MIQLIELNLNNFLGIILLTERRLGTTEHLWLRLGELDSNNFVMVAKVKGTLQEFDVQNALDALVNAQVILRSRVTNYLNRPFLKIKQNVAAKINVVERESDEQWLELAEQEINDSIPVGENPLWRLMWLKGDSQHEFILTFNHLVSDGRSGAIFFDGLFQKVNDNSYEIPQNQLFPAYEEQLCSAKYQGSFLGAWLRSAVDFLQSSRLNWYVPKVYPQEESGTGIISRFIDAEQLQTLLRRCREQETTISYYIASLMVSSVEAAEKENIGLSLAVDVRPYLTGEHTKDIGYFVTTVDLFQPSSFTGSCWDLAKAFKVTAMAKLIKPYFRFEKLIRGFVLKMAKDDKSFRQLIRKSVNNSMLLTNIGKLNQPTEFIDFKLESCFHIPAVHLVGVPFLCLATSTLNNQMQLNLSYTKAHMKESDAKAFLETVLQGLRNC